MEFQRNPVDASLNVAVKLLANKANPHGWDQVKRFVDAPTTLYDQQAYLMAHGKVCIAEEDSDGTIYDCADTNHHLRAWHDAIHMAHDFAFNAAGEAAAAYVHIAQLAARYGINATTRRWSALLLADLLGLVHYHCRTGLWPMDKREFALQGAEGWQDEANALLDDFCIRMPEESVGIAISRSRAKWGNPWETVE